MWRQVLLAGLAPWCSACMSPLNGPSAIPSTEAHTNGFFVDESAPLQNYGHAKCEKVDGRLLGTATAFFGAFKPGRSLRVIPSLPFRSIRVRNSPAAIRGNADRQHPFGLKILSNLTAGRGGQYDTLYGGCWLSYTPNPEVSHKSTDSNHRWRFKNEPLPQKTSR